MAPVVPCGPVDTTRAVIASLLGEPGVEALRDTNGRWDLLAELRTASNAELSDVLERVRLIKGIANTEASIRRSCRDVRPRFRLHRPRAVQVSSSVLTIDVTTYNTISMGTAALPPSLYPPAARQVPAGVDNLQATLAPVGRCPSRVPWPCSAFH